VPNAPILPIGIDRLSFTGGLPSSVWVVQGVERTKEGSVFTYDIDVTDMNGCLLERWEGLKLQLVGAREKGAKNARWVEPLLGPYLERQIPDLVHGMIPVSVVVDHNGTGERRLRTDRAIQRALGARVPVSRRADGKPEVPGDQCVSAAHAGEITMAVAGHGTVACDAELVTSRSVPLWRDLLGPDAFALAQVVAQQVSEGVDASATRVWTANECIKKAGVGPILPFVFSSAPVDGWVVFNAGSLAVATFLAPIRTGDCDLALAVLSGSRNGYV
jgi:enediyne polyketide synthase